MAGDLEGASVVALAARAGHGLLAHRLTGPRALLKATALAHPLFREVRSMLVVGNDVGLPPELVDHILEFCAGGDSCWFAEPAVAAAAAVAGSSPSASSSSLAASPPPPPPPRSHGTGGGDAVGGAMLLAATAAESEVVGAKRPRVV